MASTPKPDKEAIRDWLRGRRQSKAPPPSIEQIKDELFRSSPETRPDTAVADTGRRPGPLNYAAP